MRKIIASILFSSLLCSCEPVLAQPYSLASPLLGLGNTNKNQYLNKGTQFNDTALFNGPIWIPQVIELGGPNDSILCKDVVTGIMKYISQSDLLAGITGLPATIPYFDPTTGQLTSSYDIYFHPDDGDFSLFLSDDYGSSGISGGAHGTNAFWTIENNKADSSIATRHLTLNDYETVQAWISVNSQRDNYQGESGVCASSLSAYGLAKSAFMWSSNGIADTSVAVLAKIDSFSIRFFQNSLAVQHYETHYIDDDTLVIDTDLPLRIPNLIITGSGISDGDYGDISVSGSGTTFTIDNDVVTFAKFQDIADARLLGRSAGSPGDMQHITVGTGLSLAAGSLSNTITQYTDELAQDAVGGMIDASLNYVDGTPLLQRAALTGDVTATAGSNATTIANDAVTFAKFQNITDARLLGRSAGSSGDMQEITAGSTLTLSAGSLGLNLNSANTWLVDVSVPDEAYDATAWNGSVEVPTKNAIRDKIESLGGGGANTALSNLASVAINTTLLPGSDDAIDLGSDALRFHYIPFKLGSGYFGWGTGGGDAAVIATGSAGLATLAFINAGTGYSFDNKIFLPNLHVFDWNSGDLTLTHSANKLTVAGGTFAVPDDAYASGWNASTDVPTKNAVYDKMETKIGSVLTTIYITGSAATHNFTTGMLYCEVWVTGQGGGGGGARASDGSSIAGASGGGAGGTAYILYTAAEAGSSATYTVGTAGGGGGNNTGGNGSAGTNSTFDPAGTGATLTGTGGALGTGHDNATPALSVRTSGAGGVPTNGSLNITGGQGGWGMTGSITTVGPTGGAGGASFWGGGGGQTSASTTTAGQNGTAYGSGGSGATAVNASAGVTGGNGAVGVIKIVEYIK